VVLPQCEYASLDNRPRVRTGRLAGRCKEAREKDSRSRLGKVVDQPVKNNTTRSAWAGPPNPNPTAWR
jgi:hypothetical protein